MAYLIIVGFVTVATFWMISLCEKGWDANKTPLATRTTTKNIIRILGLLLCIPLISGYNIAKDWWNQYQVEIEAKEHLARVKAERESLSNKFRTNRNAILQQIRDMQRSGQLGKAKTEATKLAFTKDAEILSLIAELDTAIADAQRIAKIQALSKLIDRLDEADTGARVKAYERLVSLDPGNVGYKKKLAFYQNRGIDEFAKELREERRERRKERASRLE